MSGSAHLEQREQLLAFHQRPAGAEVLVDAGAYVLGASEQWSRVRKISPASRFPVSVELRGFGAATYRFEEIRDVRECGHASDDPVKRGRQLANLSRGGSSRRAERPRPKRRRTHSRLPSAPFVQWLEGLVLRSGGPRDAARLLGVDEARVRVLLCSSRATVDMMDRMFVAAGDAHMLATLYPWSGASHERFCSSCREAVTTSMDLCCPWCESVSVPSAGWDRYLSSARREVA